jgi:glycosyltransferase involved in cell wall biosynthesis
MMPKLSVVMSVRNHAYYLEDSIKSILNQTFSDFEFLIADDMSTDNSYDILNKLSQQDNRIRVFKNSNALGLTKTLNFLISQTNSQYIARQDADDMSYSKRFENFINNNKDKQLYTTNIEILNDATSAFTNKNNETYFVLFNFLFYYYFTGHGQLIFEKNSYNEKFKFCQDYELCSSFLRNDINCFNLNKSVDYIYRKHNNTIYKTHRSKQIYFSLTTAKNNIKHFLNIDMPLHTVYQLRNFFLEHKPPTMDKTIFLILLKKIKTVFASKYCKEENIEQLNSFINDRINSVLC